MSDSIVFYLDRGNVMHIVDPDTLHHQDTIHPVMEIAIAVINAGYSGVLIDEFQLANGRFVQCLNLNHATPEGRILAEVQEKLEPGCALPPPEAVLALIRKEYAQSGHSS